mmetsp:Transcript_9399/g.23376  ORF Transcript_9399/g.23376 Transcript_9399/m.23376 type:complete len:213 (-) Transcript_9399:267-905(-)
MYWPRSSGPLPIPTDSKSRATSSLPPARSIRFAGWKSPWIRVQQAPSVASAMSRRPTVGGSGDQRIGVLLRRKEKNKKKKQKKKACQSLEKDEQSGGEEDLPASHPSFPHAASSTAVTETGHWMSSSLSFALAHVSFHRASAASKSARFSPRHQSDPRTHCRSRISLAHQNRAWKRAAKRNDSCKTSSMVDGVVAVRAERSLPQLRGEWFPK